MRTTNLIVLIFTICSIATPVFAQTNFVSGYFVNAKSDTVKCLIEYSSSYKMGDRIRYKMAAGAKTGVLLPENIRSVAIDNKVFFETFSFTPKQGEYFTAFFKRIIKGRLSLYYYQNRYFVRKGDNPMDEVTKRTKKLSATQEMDDLTGYGLLRILITDCPSMDEQFLVDNYIKDTDYNKIVNKYNQCFPEESVDNGDLKIKSRLDIGIQGSLSMMKLDLSQTSIGTRGDQGWQPAPAGGLFLSLFSPVTGDNIRIVAMPSFGRYNGYSYFSVKGVLANDVYLKYSFVSVPIVARYFLNNIFIDAGMTNIFILKQSNSWRQEVFDTKYFVSTSNREAVDLRSGLFGLTFGVGVKAKVGGAYLLTSLRASHILHPTVGSDRDTTRPTWAEFNIALQLPHN